VSYLTTEIIEYIDAPMPYIMGIPRFLWKEIKKIRSKNDIARETAIFDINKEKYLFLGEVPNWSIHDFEPVLNCAQEIIERRMQFLGKDSSENCWMTFSLELRKAFFLSYIRLIGNHLKFFKEEVFDYEEYLSSIQANKRKFMEEFIKTQNFISFIESSANCLKEHNDLYFFLEGTKLYEEKGKGVLEEEIDKVLEFIQTNYKNVRLHLYCIRHW
jgi:hypothetical protein